VAASAPHAVEALRAGNEDPPALAVAGAVSGGDDPADRLVTRNQRIAHPGERGHGAGPQQPFGPCADAAPFDVDDDILIARLGQAEFAQRDDTGRIDDDSPCGRR
jgi:hypothetical protein